MTASMGWKMMDDFKAMAQLQADFAFTTFTEGNRDNSMKIERAKEIINELLPGNFRLEPTFIKWDGDQLVIEKSRNPSRD